MIQAVCLLESLLSKFNFFATVNFLRL